MPTTAELQLLYRVANAPVRYFPFPHIYIEDVFPDSFYRQLRENIPGREHFATLTQLKRVYGPYPDTRFVLPVAPAQIEKLEEPYRSFWYETGEWMLTGQLMNFMLAKFSMVVEHRFGKLKQEEFSHEALLVQDYSTYQLPPHTDSPKKVLATLFYLPPDDSIAHLGTSIYVPKDPSRASDGTAFEKWEDFDLACTMPFRPNCMFAFARTDDSFHGVQPIHQSNVRRDLLLYDIKTEQPARSHGTTTQ